MPLIRATRSVNHRFLKRLRAVRKRPWCPETHAIILDMFRREQRRLKLVALEAEHVGR